MTKKNAAPYLSALLLTALCLPAHAQDADPVIPTIKSQNADVKVKSTTVTTTTYEDGKTVTKEDTTVVPVTEPSREGPPITTALTNDDFPPQTDEASKLVFVTGGVGEDESTYFKTLKGDYTLKLLMADKLGHLVSGSNITIADAKGTTVIALQEVGPYLLIKMPEGKFKVTATFGTSTVTRNITITNGKLIGVDVRY